METMARSVVCRWGGGLVAAVALLAVGGASSAQGSYSVGESESKPASPQAPAPVAPAPAPRLARFDLVSGNVTWRADDGASWSKATKNVGLRQGSQVWVTEGGRAEIRFDDGSMLRLGNGALLTIHTLYSDADGEFTMIKMSYGLVTLRLRKGQSIFEVDTPTISIKANGPARVRIGASDTVEIGVATGHAAIEGKLGKKTLYTGEFVNVRPNDTSYLVQALPPVDSWERWNDERDRILAGGSPHAVYGGPVVVPQSAFWFSLDLPIGGGPRPWGGRRFWHRW